MEKFFKDVKKRLVVWNQQSNERQKMQQTYLALVLVGALIAGLVTFVNPALGHDIVQVAFYAILIFVVNAVIWNLLNSILISKLPSRSSKK